MSNFQPQDRMQGAASGLGQPTGSQSSPPLPAAEIEMLLKMAREHAHQFAANRTSEELGPGDVQYLRGLTTLPPEMNATSESMAWSGVGRNPEEVLNQAQQQLAQAILDSSSAATGSESRRDNVSHSRSASPVDRSGLSIEDLGDVELDISIELGRTEILIEDVLKLREGSVVELDKLAGDPVDIIANGRLVARGELLVIDGKFGVRLSEVL